jgi:hypothetical protein
MYSEDAVVTSSCIAPDLQLTLALFLVQMFGEVPLAGSCTSQGLPAANRHCAACAECQEDQVRRDRDSRRSRRPDRARHLSI